MLRERALLLGFSFSAGIVIPGGRQRPGINPVIISKSAREREREQQWPINCSIAENMKIPPLSSISILPAETREKRSLCDDSRDHNWQGRH